MTRVRAYLQLAAYEVAQLHWNVRRYCSVHDVITWRWRHRHCCRDQHRAVVALAAHLGWALQPWQVTALAHAQRAARARHAVLPTGGVDDLGDAGHPDGGP